MKTGEWSWLVVTFALVACSQSQGTGDTGGGDATDGASESGANDAVADVRSDTVDANDATTSDTTDTTDVATDTADVGTDTFDAHADTGNDVVVTDGGFSCGPSMTCSASQMCVRTQIEGGAVMLPNDAGMCAPGYMNVGGICQRDPTYSCVARAAACGSGPVTCSCAGACSPGYACATPSANEVDCTLFAP